MKVKDSYAILEWAAQQNELYGWWESAADCYRDLAKMAEDDGRTETAKSYRISEREMRKKANVNKRKGKVR